MLTAVTNLAAARSKLFLDQVQNIQDRKFDPDFYFAPQGVQVKSDKYAEQTQTVAKDWEKAKAGDKYWAEQAYRFGIDLNDKKAFARMHFEVKGQGLGYDAAEDILTKDKVSEQIYNEILPALDKEVLDQKTTFGQFITPEEFSSKMLEGLDPNDKTTWQKALKAAGVQDFQGTLDEFKDLVSETLRTGSAQEIRQQIKYLNEKGKKPTQEILGVEYIERPEDYTTDDIKTETEMYRVFRQAGYKGTEDDFYTDVFPDTNRSEQKFLDKAGTGSALQLKKLDLRDPYAAFGTVEGLFDNEDTYAASSADKEERGMFSLGLDDEETDYKSKTGSQILGEFTSMFKGF
jgi:ribulose bisphosphate carboxylase small subunit